MTNGGVIEVSCQAIQILLDSVELSLSKGKWRRYKVCCQAIQILLDSVVSCLKAYGGDTKSSR